MFARIEVAVRPDLLDTAALELLRRVELTLPVLRKKIRWARVLEVYWIDVPVSREELIPAVSEICWDKVLQWVFTGNLMPSAAGKTGGLQDLMEFSPIRPGHFCGIERRFRAGITDSLGRSLLEALEIALGRSLPDGRSSSGSLLMLEGPELNEEILGTLAREVFCNELIETWTLVPEEALRKNERFHQERIKYDLPKLSFRTLESAETVRLQTLTEEALKELSHRKRWGFSTLDLRVIQNYFQNPEEQPKRRTHHLSDPTDTEMEVIAQSWSEMRVSQIMNAEIQYREGSEIPSVGIPDQIFGLSRQVIAATTKQIAKTWLLSAFQDNGAIVAFDDEDALCIQVETRDCPERMEPYAWALSGVMTANRKVLSCGAGARSILNTYVACLGNLDSPSTRWILHGANKGIREGGQKLGVPVLSGGFVFEDRFLEKPLLYCGTVGMLPRNVSGEPGEVKEVRSQDLVCMVGGRMGRDGTRATPFSSSGAAVGSSGSATQLGDPLLQKRITAFLLQAKEEKFYRASQSIGQGGLASALLELARIAGGAMVELTLAKTKTTGLRALEILMSESPERMLVAVRPECWAAFERLAQSHGVEISTLGKFNSLGRLEIFHDQRCVVSLGLDFLHFGMPRPERIKAEWKRAPRVQGIYELSAEGPLREKFRKEGANLLLALLGQPEIASKEWLIRQMDHEVQGMSVIKPLQTVSTGTATVGVGPNDASMIKPKPNSDIGLAVGCGINSRLFAIDPFIMAQSAADEAVRNVLCVGAEFGLPESVIALIENIAWPDPTRDPEQAAGLVRLCYGMRDAALALSVPLLSGKERGEKGIQGTISSLLLMTAIARVPDIKQARTSDVKGPGEALYILGPHDLGLGGAALQSLLQYSLEQMEEFGPVRVGGPTWNIARRIYYWLGGANGRQQSKVKSLHDISDGGLGVAVTESLLARGIGARIEVPAGKNPFEFFFGEGFHGFVASVSLEDISLVESEWHDLGVPFKRIGKTESHSRLEVYLNEAHPSTEMRLAWSVDVKQLRASWQKDGFWE